LLEKKKVILTLPISPLSYFYINFTKFVILMGGVLFNIDSDVLLGGALLFLYTLISKVLRQGKLNLPFILR